MSDEIRKMAMLSLLSNRINPIQEKNLKLFPLVALEGVKTVVVDYDLSTVKTDEDEPPINNSKIKYYLRMDESIQNDNLDKRFLFLEQCVRNLFWSDISLEIYFNDRIVFKSKEDER